MKCTSGKSNQLDELRGQENMPMGRCKNVSATRPLCSRQSERHAYGLSRDFLSQLQMRVHGMVPVVQRVKSALALSDAVESESRYCSRQCRSHFAFHPRLQSS